MKILLVDDNRELRTSTLELLEIQGHRIEAAAGGEAALELARAMEFDLLITDLSMPGMDGIDLAEKFRDAARNSSRPPAVLMISSQRDYPGLERYLVEKDAVFLQKPFSASALERAVERSVARAPATASIVAPSPGIEAPPIEAEGHSRPLAVRQHPVVSLHTVRTRSSTRFPAWGLAAALVLSLATAGVLRMLDRPVPRLPAPPSVTSPRNAELEILEPVGPISALPSAFRWHEIEGVDSYRVTVRSVDGTQLWHGRTTQPWLDISADLGAKLQPAVAYTWTVEALGSLGERLAWSRATRFRVLSVKPRKEISSRNPRE